MQKCGLNEIPIDQEIVNKNFTEKDYKNEEGKVFIWWMILKYREVTLY